MRCHKLFFHILVAVMPMFLMVSNCFGDSRGVRLTPQAQQTQGAVTPSGVERLGRSGARRALIVGNSRYAVSPLTNPAHDAEDVAQALKELGFSVTLLIDADKDGMLGAINGFGRELAAGDVGVFYFAGHGMQINGKNYLLPVDVGMVRSQSEVPYQGVSVQLMIDRMETAGNMMNLVVLDACRDNPFAANEAHPRGLAQMDAPKGTLIVYATKPGSTAEDGVGRNGVFTRRLLGHIASSEDIQFMLRRVRAEVIEETGGRQIPWDEGTLVEGFSLGNRQVKDPQPHIAVAPSAAPQPSPRHLELPRTFRQKMGDVEALGNTQNGELTLVFISQGASTLQNPVQWRVAAEREALKKAKKAATALLTQPPYALSEGRVSELFARAKVVDAEFTDEAKRVSIKYQITLDDRYH